MLRHQLSTPQWLSIPLNLRIELAKTFSLVRSGDTIVENNKVKSDGFSHDDLAALTVEKMKEYVTTDETDYYKVLDLVLAKMQMPTQSPQTPTSPVPTLSKEEAERFRNEYNQRQNDKKNAEEAKRNEDAKAATTTPENKGAVARRGRPKKGSGTIEGGGEGEAVSDTV